MNCDNKKGFLCKALVVLVVSVALISLIFMSGPMGSCKGGEMDLIGRGVITGLHLEGKDMRVIMQNNENYTEVVTVDPCTGKERGSVVFKGQSPKPVTAAPAKQQ